MTDLRASLPTRKELEKADEEIGILHMCAGQTADGRDFYAYVNMQPSRYLEYIEATERGDAVVLSEYGEIIESGFGAVPPESVQKAMNEKYQADQTFFEELARYMLEGDSGDLLVLRGLLEEALAAAKHEIASLDAAGGQGDIGEIRVV